MDSTFTERWIKKFRILTLSLIFSGALNIGLIAAFVAVMMQDREKSFSVSAPKSSTAVEEATNQKMLAGYAHLTFRELCALLTNTDFVEEGYRKRDLAPGELFLSVVPGVGPRRHVVHVLNMLLADNPVNCGQQLQAEWRLESFDKIRNSFKTFLGFGFVLEE